MKKSHVLASPFCLLFGFAALGGTPFDSGSDGSDGALSVGQDADLTIQVPEDGILNYTTIDLGFRADVFFLRNSANTPIYLLASGDVNLAGRFWVSGQSGANQVQGGLGGPGGFNGGPGGSNPGDGLGPGGGKGGPETGGDLRGSASFGTAGNAHNRQGAVYGNPLLVPLIGGSAGGGSDSGWGGGGGGGAICIASNTTINCLWNPSNVVPVINAKGGTSNSSTGVGSGGAVRLVAPVVSGIVYVNLQPGHPTYGGFGRGRIDSQSPGQLSLYTGDSASAAQVTFGANMVVFPPNMPTVRITEAAGQSIDPTRVDPVFVLLPVGSPQAQTVEISVENFGTVVPIRVILTPEQGEQSTYDIDIDNTGGGISTGTANVQVPAGTSVRIDAWTR